MEYEPRKEEMSEFRKSVCSYAKVHYSVCETVLICSQDNWKILRQDAQIYNYYPEEHDIDKFCNQHLPIRSRCDAAFAFIYAHMTKRPIRYFWLNHHGQVLNIFLDLHSFANFIAEQIQTIQYTPSTVSSGSEWIQLMYVTDTWLALRPADATDEESDKDNDSALEEDTDMDL
jgi:hypothetical protein